MELKLNILHVEAKDLYVFVTSLTFSTHISTIVAKAKQKTFHFQTFLKHNEGSKIVVAGIQVLHSTKYLTIAALFGHHSHK
jgi:hypothetical protein